MKIKKETAIKILATMLTIFMLATCIQSTVFAETDYMDPNTIKPNDTTGAVESVQTAAGNILAIVQVIAISTAIIMLIVLAIKYISSAPNDKAEIKKHAVIYVVGAVLLFGASGILELVKSFAGSAFSAGKTGAKQ